MKSIFAEIEEINKRPRIFGAYTAEELWTDEHTANQMLEYHLNEAVDLSSRNHEFIKTSLDWIVDTFGLTKGSRVIDFGCGPGLYTSAIAEKGADVTGVDFSENSLRYAKKKADEQRLAIQYIHQNYLDYDGSGNGEETFDLITMIMCDFCALNPEQRGTMLDKFHGLLKDDGRLLLDVYSLNRFEKLAESFSYEFNSLNGFWSAQDYYGFQNTFLYDNEKVVLDKYTIIEASRVCTVYNWLQHYSKESLTQEFASYGLEIEAFYSNVAGQPYDPDSDEIAIVVRKQ